MTGGESNSERVFYMDFSLDGGVVNAHPTREPATSLVLPTAALKSNTHTKVERFAEKVRVIIPEAVRLAISARRSSVFARSKLREILAFPEGLIDVGESYYFGYFKVAKPASPEDKVFSRENDILRLHVSGNTASVSRIFKMEPEEVTQWAAVIGQKPLDYSQWVELRTQTGDETMHPLYRSLLSMNLNDRLNSNRTYLDEFWAEVKTLLGRDDQPAQEEYLRSHIVKLAVVGRVAAWDRKRLLSKVSRTMFDAGITALSTGEGAIIGYKVDGSHIRYRSFPIPPERIGLFQRSLFLGEKPLTESEVSLLYRTHVDPNTDQFGDGDNRLRNILQEQAAIERGDFFSALQMRLKRNYQKPPNFKYTINNLGSITTIEASCNVSMKDGKIINLSVSAGNKKDAKQRLSKKIYDTLS